MDGRAAASGEYRSLARCGMLDPPDRHTRSESAEKVNGLAAHAYRMLAFSILFVAFISSIYKLDGDAI